MNNNWYSIDISVITLYIKKEKLDLLFYNNIFEFDV